MGASILFITHWEVAEHGFLWDTLSWSIASGLCHFKSRDIQAANEHDKAYDRNELSNWHAHVLQNSQIIRYRNDSARIFFKTRQVQHRHHEARAQAPGLEVLLQENRGLYCDSTGLSCVQQGWAYEFEAEMGWFGSEASLLVAKNLGHLWRPEKYTE